MKRNYENINFERDQHSEERQTLKRNRLKKDSSERTNLKKDESEKGNADKGQL